MHCFLNQARGTEEDKERMARGMGTAGPLLIISCKLGFVAVVVRRSIHIDALG